MNNDIIIIGAFHETIELCELCGFHIVGIIDNARVGTYLGYPILGNDDDARILYEEYPHAGIVLGPDSSIVRQKLFLHYSQIGFSFATVVSPKAFISKSASIGEGSIVQSGVNVSANSHIGRFCKLNFNCNIMHDVCVGDYSIIAPCAVVLGRSRIGESVYIGANATIDHDSFVANSTQIQSSSFYTNHNE